MTTTFFELYKKLTPTQSISLICRRGCDIDRRNGWILQRALETPGSPGGRLAIHVKPMVSVFLQGIFQRPLKLHCDMRFQRAFTALGCIFKVITLVWNAGLGTEIDETELNWTYTGGPHYMREIGTPNIDSNITNLHIKSSLPRLLWSKPQTFASP